MKRKKLRKATFPELWQMAVPSFPQTRILRWSPANIAALLLLCSLLSSGGAKATPQSKAKSSKAYALIFGTVWGPDDHPVYGVKVKIRRAEDKKTRWELASDHSGEFAQRLAAGRCDYVVTADVHGLKRMSGKKLQAGTAVTVHVENDERVDMSLHLTE